MKTEYTLPSQEVCAQLDIKHEELESALAAVEEISGCKAPRRPCYSPIGFVESAVALEHQASDDLAYTVAELQRRLTELREHCESATSYLRSIEATYMFVGGATSMNVKVATFDAARDAAAEAARNAGRAADLFQRDWDRRRALARLGGGRQVD
jgi:hypothetical protein